MPQLSRKPLFDNARHGFSLLELAVVVTIVSVMAGSGMVVGKATMDSAEVATTNSRMQVIETALLAFRRANDRIPCPGNATILPSSGNYGKEAANSGTCTGGTPAANYSVTSGGSLIVEGSLPTRTLNLPDEYMYDGWGHKFVYSMWAPASGPRGFINYGVSSNCGLQSIRNSVGMARSNNGVYTLLSLGPNGHGAFNEMGQRLTSHSVNSDELINCHCNTNGADTGYTGTYVQKDTTENPANPLDVFDDVLIYKERWQLQNYYDEYNPGGYLVCPSNGPGLRTYGLAANDTIGYAMAMADVNGDGIQDLIIGIPRELAAGSAGSVAVVFGKATGLPNPLPLSGLDGTNGFMINSSESNDWAGAALTTGDFNGDNIPDIVIGAPHGNGSNGRAYVVFGHTGAWTPTVALSGLNGTTGFVITDNMASGSPELFGASMATGDITLDGRADLVVGAPGAASNKGSVYIVLGKAAAWSASNNLSTLYSSMFTGGTGYRSGTSVAVADVNGDGIQDVIMGAPGDGATMPGTVTVLLGRIIGWNYYNLNNFWGYNGYVITGENNGDLFGQSVATGDVDGNYVKDLVIGAPGWGGNTGAVYINFGYGGRKIGYNNAGTFNGVSGVRLSGVTAGDKAGSAVAVADVNGDGFGDVIVGAPGASPGGLAGAGSTYITFGHTGWGSTFNLSGLNGTNGFLLNGSTAGDATGMAFAVGDLNSDYNADFALGAPLADYTFTNSGAVYLFYGQRKPAPWTLLVDLNTL